MSDDIYLTGDDEGVEDRKRGEQPSELENQALYLQLKQWFLLDDAHSKEWREQAKKDFDFVAGDQWEDSTRKALEAEGRYPLTFNYIGPFVEAVRGLEIGTRHEVMFLPRVVEPGDIIANETVANTSNWMGDNCNAGDEQSEAFGDTVICGMGWLDARMSYEEDDPDGKYMEEKLDVQEMRWDRSAKKKNLTDARRVWRVQEMTLDEARDMFPDAQDADLDAAWACGFDVGGKLVDEDESRLKLENSHPTDPSGVVRIVQIQWIEREKYFRVAQAQGVVEVTPEEMVELRNMAKAARVKLVAVPQYRKVRKQAFLGAKVLGVGPCPDKHRFTLQCITGKLHKTKRTWYGLVKLMRDPQINANKWLSQALHIMNSTAKGGVLAEEGVFRNIQDAQKTYSNPQAITTVRDGAIQKKRIMAKPGAGLAAPYVQLVQLAIQAIPGVTGINLELLGMVDRNQAGILEAQRKQAGMTILATLFDALKLYRKTNGLTRLCFMQNDLQDGTIIRINGPEKKQAIRFIRDEHMGNYDVIVDDAPNSPNMKEQTWTMLMQMAQSEAMARLLEQPEVTVEALNYCPLPSKIVQLLQKGISQPNPARDEAQAIAKADAEAKVAKTQADTVKQQTAAGLDTAKSVLTMAQAAVQQQQLLREQAINDFVAAAKRSQVPGMPPRMPALMQDPGLAAGDDQVSDLPELGALPPGQGQDDMAALLASVPTDAYGAPAA